MSRQMHRDLVIGVLGLALTGVVTVAVLPTLERAYRDYTVGAMLYDEQAGDVYLPLQTEAVKRLVATPATTDVTEGFSTEALSHETD